MFKKILISSLAFLTFSAGVVFASTDFIKFNGYISDKAGLLTPDTAENLNLTIHDLNQKTKSAIAIITVKSLDDKDIEKISDNVMQEYKIGDDEKQNGVIFFISMDDHQLQFMLGDGLSGKIKLKKLKKIVDDNVIPYFSSGEYDKGIVRGTYMIADEVAKIDGVKIKHYGVMPEKKLLKNQFNKNWLWLLLLPFIVIVGIFVRYILLRKNKNDKEY